MFLFFKCMYTPCVLGSGFHSSIIIILFFNFQQIHGEDFPKIFQDSLDGNILSQILNVLATEFVAANEPVLSYIQGLTHVKRFRTLTLFLSSSDKNSEYCL